MKIRRIKAVSYKEFIHLFRDVRSLLVIILVPVLLLILFGYALKLDVEKVKTAIVNYDDSSLSRDYISKFTSNNSFDIKYYPLTTKDAEKLLDTNKVKAIIVIPAGFGRDLNEGKDGEVQAILDGSEITSAASIINYIQGVTAIYNSVRIADFMRSNGITSSRGYAAPEIRFWFNEDMRSVNYLFPGLVAIILSVVAGFLTSLTISREWEGGTMEQLIPTPLTESEVIAGKLITYFTIGFIDFIIYIFMGEFLFKVPILGSSLLVFLFAVIFLIGMLAFGTLISITMKSQLASGQVTIMSTMLPAFLLSGFIFDIGNMPILIQWVTYLFPARYFVEILRGLYLKGVGLEYLLFNGIFLTVYALVMLVLCRAAFRMRA